jgi:hypothetical protein
MGISAGLGTAGLQPAVCTSTTRPAAPYEGQMIYETDTNRLVLYNGSSWVYIADTDTPSGMELVKAQTVGSGVSSVNITSVFSSTYDNYLISYSNITASVNGNAMQIKMLVGTTPTTNGFYGNTFYIGNAFTGGLTNANFVNSSYGEVGCMTSTFKNASTWQIQQPFLSTQTLLQFSAVDNNYWRHGSFVVNNSTSYDGFQLLPNSGTMTDGTICVYGLRITI